MTIVTELIFFGNSSCPYCARVLRALKSKGKAFVFVEMPLDRNLRSQVKHEGMTFGDLFEHDISIPKMITPEGKLYESADMLAYLEKNE